jgi:hypothetical protein
LAWSGWFVAGELVGLNIGLSQFDRGRIRYSSAEISVLASAFNWPFGNW